MFNRSWKAWNIQKYLKHGAQALELLLSINIQWHTSTQLKPSVFPAMQSYWVPPASPSALTNDAPWQRCKFHQATEFLQVISPRSGVFKTWRHESLGKRSIDWCQRCLDDGESFAKLLSTYYISTSKYYEWRNGKWFFTSLLLWLWSQVMRPKHCYWSLLPTPSEWN